MLDVLFGQLAHLAATSATKSGEGVSCVEIGGCFAGEVGAVDLARHCDYVVSVVMVICFVVVAFCG